MIRGAYEVGALGATDEAIAALRAPRLARGAGPLSALTPDGVVPTPDEQGAVYVLPVGACRWTLEAQLMVDWRDGDVW